MSKIAFRNQNGLRDEKRKLKNGLSPKVTAQVAALNGSTVYGAAKLRNASTPDTAPDVTQPSFANPPTAAPSVNTPAKQEDDFEMMDGKKPCTCGQSPCQCGPDDANPTSGTPAVGPDGKTITNSKLLNTWSDAAREAAIAARQAKSSGRSDEYQSAAKAAGEASVKADNTGHQSDHLNAIRLHSIAQSKVGMDDDLSTYHDRAIQHHTDAAASSSEKPSKTSSSGSRTDSDSAFDKIERAGGKNVSTSSGGITYTHPNGQEKFLAHTDQPNGHRDVDSKELESHLNGLKGSVKNSRTVYPSIKGNYHSALSAMRVKLANADMDDDDDSLMNIDIDDDDDDANTPSGQLNQPAATIIYGDQDLTTPAAALVTTTQDPAVQ